MRAMTVVHGEGRQAFLGQLDRFTQVCSGLSDRDLLAASRCWGWSVLEVVVHTRTGLEEMQRGFLAPTADPPDTDAGSYWRAVPPETDPTADEVDGILWTRRAGSAYRRPRTAVAHLRQVADAVSRAASLLPDSSVRFQGHVLASGDFLATWAVELAVHHLDLTAELDVPPPTDQSLRLARLTVEALLDADLPSALEDTTAVLIGSGRRKSRPDEARVLGELGDRLPVLG